MDRKTKQILVGPVRLGDGAPVAVQSMCNTDTRDARATLSQIELLAQAGCDIVRVAVPDMEAAEALRQICASSPVPIVADIHFDYQLALAACRNGVHKIRLNPGNIGGMDRVREVAAACRDRGIPIRIGVNGGSLERDIETRFGSTAEGMVESAMRHIDMLEQCGFYDICVSLKASDVKKTIDAYRLLHTRCNYPLHLGVTEAGSERMGTIKSAAAFGALLCDGIGDTIRVSLTADPVQEVRAGRDILRALGMAREGINLISCPTCGRTQINLIAIAEEVERRLANVKARLTVAVMGCAVNGPGEARGADVGIAGGRAEGVLFRNGEIIAKFSEDKLADALVDEVRRMTGEQI